MSRRSPALLALLLPFVFIFLLVLFLPAIAGSAEQEHNVTDLTHSEGASGALNLMLSGDMILPALGILVIIAFLMVGFARFGKMVR